MGHDRDEELTPISPHSPPPPTPITYGRLTHERVEEKAGCNIFIIWPMLPGSFNI